MKILSSNPELGFRGLGFGGLSESVANAEECNIMLGSLAATVKAQPADHYDRLEEQSGILCN